MRGRQLYPITSITFSAMKHLKNVGQILTKIQMKAINGGNIPCPCPPPICFHVGDSIRKWICFNNACVLIICYPPPPNQLAVWSTILWNINWNKQGTSPAIEKFPMISRRSFHSLKSIIMKQLQNAGIILTKKQMKNIMGAGQQCYPLCYNKCVNHIFFGCVGSRCVIGSC